MKSRRWLPTTLVAGVVLVLGCPAFAASPPEDCALPRSLALFCPALDVLQAPLGMLQGFARSGSEADADGSELPPAPPGETQVEGGPGDGSTEAGPSIDPQG